MPRRRSATSARTTERARKARAAGSAEALFHALELGVHGPRSAAAEFDQVATDLRDFLAPGVLLDAEQFLDDFGPDVQALEVQILRSRQVADGGFLRACAARDAVEHPGQHAQVVAETRPQELAVRALAEPVDVEDLRRVLQLCADVQPVLEVVTEVVAAEGLHGHGVAAHHAHGAGGCRGGLGSDRSAYQYTVLPVASLVHKRGDLASP